MAPCSGYYYCTTSFNKAWTRVLRRLKPCQRRVGDSRWWGSLTVVLAGNKTERFSSVNHTTKTIHHHQKKLVFWIKFKQIPVYNYIICTFFIVIGLNSFVCSYCCKLFVIFFFTYFLKWCIAYLVFYLPCAHVTCIGYFLV